MTTKLYSNVGVLVGQGLLVLSKRGTIVASWPVDSIASIESINMLFGKPGVRVNFHAEPSVHIYKFARGAVQGPDVVLVPHPADLARFVDHERFVSNRVARRENLGAHGELLPEDLTSALGEVPASHGPCLYLGFIDADGEPRGPGWRGMAIAGPTKFGIMRLPYDPRAETKCEWRWTYDDIVTAGIRFQEAAGTMLVEFICKPYTSKFYTAPSHHAVRLPAPAVLGAPNVTDLILTTLGNKVVPEASAEGMLLLPLTSDPEPPTA